MAGKTSEWHIAQGNWTIPFLTTEKWLNSLNFKVSCYFRTFVVEWCHFVNNYVQLEELSFEFPRVAWHDLSCFLGKTISDNFVLLPVIFKHFSRSSVCCMLSKWISSIGLLIVSEVTENPTAKFVKFFFCVTLLILIPGTHMSSSRFLLWTQLVCFENYATFSELVLKVKCCFSLWIFKYSIAPL